MLNPYKLNIASDMPPKYNDIDLIFIFQNGVMEREKGKIKRCHWAIALK